MESCGRLFIGLLAMKCNLREGRLTIGRRIPSCPTRLGQKVLLTSSEQVKLAGMSSILLDRTISSRLRFFFPLANLLHPFSSAFSNGSIEVVSQFLQRR